MGQHSLSASGSYHSNNAPLPYGLQNYNLAPTSGKMVDIEQTSSKWQIHQRTSLLRYVKQYGPSINDVKTLWRRGYEGFCDNSANALLLKRVTMGGGCVQNYQKLRDVIFGQPLCLPQTLYIALCVQALEGTWVLDLCYLAYFKYYRKKPKV